MSAILVLAMKDLRLLTRDRGAMFWACVFPLMFATLFGAIFPHESRAPKVVVAVADDDDSVASRALVEALSRPGAGLTVARASSATAAADSVRRGEAAAMVHVPRGFVAGAPLELSVDPGRGAEAAFVEGSLMKMLAVPTMERQVVRRAVTGIVAPRSGFELAFPAAVLWGLIGCSGAFAAATVAERRSGTHQRVRSAPVSPLSVVLGKLVACLVACALDATLLLLVAKFAFGVRVEQFLGLPLAILSCAACFAGITVLLGMLGKTEQSVGGASWATLLLLAMIGGAMVPLSAMPGWMRTLSTASPVRWGIVALEGATFRGLSVAELAPACAVLIAFGFVSVTLGAAVAWRESS